MQPQKRVVALPGVIVFRVNHQSKRAIARLIIALAGVIVLSDNLVHIIRPNCVIPHK
jgi:hypothetical protein